MGGYFEGGLRREGNGSRPCERAGEPRKDREVRVKLDALTATDAERREGPFVLEPAELALDGHRPA
jgi:hypothetical protein